MVWVFWLGSLPVPDIMSLGTIVEPGEGIGWVLGVDSFHRDEILPLQSRKQFLVILPHCQKKGKDYLHVLRYIQNYVNI